MSLWIALNQATRILRGLVIPKLLEPASYGLWTSLSVVLGYAQYADLGVNEQMGKRLPYRLGKEGESGFKDLAGQGAGWGLATSGLVALALLAWSFLYTGPAPEFYTMALRLLAVAAVVQKLRVMGSTLLSSRFMFRQASIGGMMVDGVGLILAVVFLLWWGVLGLVWAFLATELLVAAYFFAQAGFPLPRFSPRKTWPMVAEGFVLLAVILTEQGLMTVDQLFLISCFPREDYGVYALGLFLVAALLSASAIFLSVTQPKVMHLAGEGKLNEARTVVQTSLLLYLVVLAALVGAAVFAMDLTVSFYLTKYRAGLGVFALMPLIALVRGPVVLLRPLFLARNEERRLIAIEACGLVLAVVLDIAVVTWHPSLPLIALASILGYGVVALGMAWHMHAFSGASEKGANRFTLAVTLAAAAGALSLFLFYRVRTVITEDALPYIAEGAIACAAYTAWVGLIIWMGRRHCFEAWQVFRHGSGVEGISLAPPSESA